MARTWRTIPSSGDGLAGLSGFSNEEMRQYLHGFCEWVTRRILVNFQRQHFGISPQGENRYTGDLERSIHYTITSAAGGNNNLVEFYYLYYGQFVETAVGHGHKAREMTMPIPAITGDRSGPKAVMRPKSDNYNRAIKPFITSEIRTHIRRVLPRMAKKFLYAGVTTIYSTVEDMSRYTYTHRNHAISGGEALLLVMDEKLNLPQLPRDISEIIQNMKLPVIRGEEGR